MAHPNPTSLMDRLFFQLFYRRRLWDYDLPEHRVGWKCRFNQETRFSVLADISDLEGKKVLDVGCGLGCLYAFLKGRGWEGDYTGFDLLGPMVKEARRRFPGVRFEKRDIGKDLPREAWDIVLMSGLFNHRIRDNRGQMRRVVGAAWGLAREALAFNVLRWVDGFRDSDMFYAREEDLRDIAEPLAPGKWRMVTGYLPDDITVYLYKNG